MNSAVYLVLLMNDKYHMPSLLLSVHRRQIIEWLFHFDSDKSYPNCGQRYLILVKTMDYNNKVR